MMATNTEFKKEVDRVSVQLKKNPQYPHVYAWNSSCLGTRGMVDKSDVHIIIKNIAKALGSDTNELLEVIADRYVKMTAVDLVTNKLTDDKVAENK